MEERVHTPNIPPITLEQKTYYLFIHKKSIIMLKSNEQKVAKLLEGKAISDKLAEAMRGKSENERLNKAANSAGGGAAEWKDSVGQEYQVVGFDVIESDVRVYKNKRKSEFENLVNDGAKIMHADGKDSNGDELGDYVMRPIAYVAALVSGGDRASISVTTLQSAARVKFTEEPTDVKYLKMSAPTPADFVAEYADKLVGRTIKLVKFEAKPNRFDSTTNVCGFDYVAEQA